MPDLTADENKFIYAVSTGDLESVALMLQIKDYIAALQEKKYTDHLFLAMVHNDYKMLSYVFSHGATINHPYEELYLEKAAEKSTANVVRLIASHITINVNATKALHFAAGRGNLEIMDILITQFGADVNYKFAGERPLEYALKAKEAKAVNFLIDHGADINIKDSYGYPLVDEIKKLLKENNLSDLPQERDSLASQNRITLLEEEIKLLKSKVEQLEAKLEGPQPSKGPRLFC